MTSYTRDGTVGPWAREKLEALGKYLSAYTTIMRKQDWCRSYFYVDAFAGAGKARLRTKSTEFESSDLFDELLLDQTGDTDGFQYINGSPRVALDIKHPFTEYIFIDNNSERVSKLKDIRKDYEESRNIQILEQDANEALKTQILDKGKYHWQRTRGIVFLDPFGLQVPWETIELLSKTKAIEIIVNFPVGMAIQRLLPISGDIPTKHRELLNVYLGSPDWYEQVYYKEKDLFDDRTRKHQDSGRKLVKWYQRRLAEAFDLTSLPRLIRNSTGGHLYYLIWAGHNKNGQKIANEILKQGEVIK